MNKAELIRAIAKRAGIPDVNAKLFFEVLLKRLPEVLQPGQAADFSGIGFLQLRKGRLQIDEKNEDKIKSDNDLELIVFYDKVDEPDTNNLIFNIPEIDSQPKDLIEQSFSPSIGKPVIPLQGVKENEYYSPLSGKELKDLVSSRVETLLSEVNIIRDYAQGSELLLITPTKYSKDQFEVKWDDLALDDEEVDMKSDADQKDDRIKTTERIEWEYGAELSKQIEEESILDTDKDEVSLLTPEDKKTKKGDNDWNFGITQEEIPQTEKIPMKEEELVDDKEKDTIEIVEEKSPIEEKPEYQKIDTLYERLKAKRGVDTEEFDLTWSFGETIEKESPKKIIEEIPKPKHFPEKPIEKDSIKIPEDIKTKSITDEIIEENVVPSRTIEEKFKTVEETQETFDDVVISKEDKVIITREKPTLTKEKTEKKKPKKVSSTTQKRKTYQHTSTYSKRGSTVPFIIGVFTILTIAVILFFVLTDNKFDILNFTKKQSPVVKKTLFAGTNIIDRNYDIPVSITDPNIVKNMTNNTLKQKHKIKSPVRKKPIKKNSSTLNSNKKKIPIVPLQPGRIKALRNKMNDVVKATKNKELNIPVKKENKKDIDPSGKFTFENLPAPVDTAKLHSNVFRYGNTYTVQVSSWKSPITAESESSKLKAKGYDAFVAKALIPNKGYWYRVRVRNFKTLREAENFLLLYQ